MLQTLRCWLGVSGLVAAVVSFEFSAPAAATVCEAIAANLVTNCGFESGSFSDWTTTPAASGSLFGVAPVEPHSGTFAAFFAAVTPPFGDTISQNISTVPGQSYAVTFFLANDGGGPNQFTASFGGTQLFSITNLGAFSYQEVDRIVTATGNSTPLSFFAFQEPSFFRLDDISVVPRVVPEPTSMALLGSGLLAFGAIRRRRHKL